MAEEFGWTEPQVPEDEILSQEIREKDEILSQELLEEDVPETHTPGYYMGEYRELWKEPGYNPLDL